MDGSDQQRAVLSLGFRKIPWTALWWEGGRGQVEAEEFSLISIAPTYGDQGTHS